MITKLIESSKDDFAEKLYNFLNTVWQEDTEIYFVSDLEKYLEKLKDVSKNAEKIKKIIKILYKEYGKQILLRTSDRFSYALDDLMK